MIAKVIVTMVITNSYGILTMCQTVLNTLCIQTHLIFIKKNLPKKALLKPHGFPWLPDQILILYRGKY